MDALLEKRLNRLKNYPTKYELVATHKTGRQVLVGYTSRKTRDGLFDMVVKHAEAWTAFTSAARIHFDKKASNGATMDDWTIKFSGRTQRDCYCNGELPFILDLVSVYPKVEAA